MIKKCLLVVAGWVCVILGVIGIVLPVLPTTPFLLLAATCFAKSSKRFHRWILSSPICGNIICDWQTHRYIKKKMKVWAMTVVIVTFSVSIAVVPLAAVKVALVVMMGLCLSIMYCLPTQPQPITPVEEMRPPVKSKCEANRCN